MLGGWKQTMDDWGGTLKKVHQAVPKDVSRGGKKTARRCGGQ